MNHPYPNGTKTLFILGTQSICVYPGWRNLLLCLSDLQTDFVPLSMHGIKKSATFTEHQHFCILSNFMTEGYQSSHNETAASAWQQQNADWWSEIKKTNHDTHCPENSPTNRCGMMDTDDEAAGQLRSTDLHCTIVAALEGHEKQPIHYHALRNNYTSLM
jgi:hypothetical protein